MMAHTTRALQLVTQAIREADGFEQLEQLVAVTWEMYAGDADAFQDLMREIEARMAVLTQRLEQGEMFNEGEP